MSMWHAAVVAVVTGPLGCYHEYQIGDRAVEQARFSVRFHDEAAGARECLEEAKQDAMWQKCLTVADRRLADQPDLASLRITLASMRGGLPAPAQRQVRLDELRAYRAAYDMGIQAQRIGSEGRPGIRVALETDDVADLPKSRQWIAPDGGRRIKLLSGRGLVIAGSILLPVGLGLTAGSLPGAIPVPSGGVDPFVALGLSFGVAGIVSGLSLLITSPHVRSSERPRIYW